MTDRRILETTKYLLLTHNFWRVFCILALFVHIVFPTVICDATDTDWISDGLLNRSPDPWYAVYTVTEVLRFELIGFEAELISKLISPLRMSSSGCMAMWL